MKLSLIDLMRLSQERTNQLFSHYLRNLSASAPILQDAMAYGVLNGGKRIRPLLVYTTGYALGATIEEMDAPAAAVEIIHAYSLIHDDLPAMDNAELRRGKPACHKAFNEAMAILAGDALQSLAIQILASHPSNLNIAQRLNMIATLSEASGLSGMASGQALDISITNNPPTENELTTLYSLKTGALLRASIKLGILSAELKNIALENALIKYAEYLGLAFQLQDDLLDQENHTGKPHGLDIINQKMTYPILFGVEKTQQKIEELTSQALQAIAPLEDKATLFYQVADLLLRRKQ